ncbi:MAG: hypothetical protein ACFCUG_07180 [Thiotrichales bacterium]
MMNALIFALFGRVLIAGLLAAFELPIAMWHNRRTADHYRDRLLADMRDTCLHRMLVALGINPRRHLHHTSVVSVVREMRDRAGCQATATCDQALHGTTAVKIDEINYCPNQASLMRAVGEKAQS